MASHVIAYNRPWYKSLPNKLASKTGCIFTAIESNDELNRDYLNSLNPDYIFFPHWSFVVPAEIYESFNCIIFHMTDLPYGRGGTPLQNLIIRGYKDTMISAIRCIEEIDAGPVYLKNKLSLEGSAEEIYIRAMGVIEKMIIEIIETNPKPVPQRGKIVKFKRRKPEDGNWSNAQSLDEVYNYIRMLDAKEYPPAFVSVGNYKLEFSKASLTSNSINACVKISKREKNE